MLRSLCAKKVVPLQPEMSPWRLCEVYATAYRLTEKPLKYKLNKAMYAIVEIQGQQFKVEEGKKLFVHHIKDVEAGKTVEFDKVLLVDADGAVKVGAPTVDGAKVVVEVVNPLVKGDKVIVFKMKRRKDSRKRNGHREQFTQVEVKQVIA